MNIQVLIDLNRDELFSHPLSDVTARVRDSWTFTSGWTNVGQVESNVAAHVAPVNQMQLVLDNKDGQLAFENTTAQFYNLIHSGIMVRITVSDNGLSYNFTYFAKSIKEALGEFGQQVVVISCVCAMPRVQRLNYEPDVAESVTTDVALTTMMGTGHLVLPYTSGFFFIDGHDIDSTVNIFDPSTDVSGLIDFETGYSTLAYVGDVLHEDRKGLSVQKAQLFIAGMCMAEAFGRFFYQPRDVKFHFHNRYHDRLQTVALSLSGGDYVSAPPVSTPVYNEARLHYSPRSIGDSDALLFSSDGVPITIANGRKKELGIRYTDPDNPATKITALTVVEPVKSTDIIVTNSDSVDVTNFVFKSADLNASGGTLFFHNSTGDNVTIELAKVRGVPITTYQPEIATAQNGTSMITYNWLPLPDLRGDYITDGEFAQSVVDFLVLRHKTMRRVIESVTFIITDDNFADVMDVTIGDVVQIQDSWSVHNTEYVVLGEFHQYDIAYDRYSITWYLRSNDTTPYFIIDTSSIDSNDLIGY
jgi:hypothetical protein